MRFQLPENTSNCWLEIFDVLFLNSNSKYYIQETNTGLFILSLTFRNWRHHSAICRSTIDTHKSISHIYLYTCHGWILKKFWTWNVFVQELKSTNLFHEIPLLWNLISFTKNVLMNKICIFRNYITTRIEEGIFFFTNSFQ